MEHSNGELIWSEYILCMHENSQTRKEEREGGRDKGKEGGRKEGFYARSYIISGTGEYMPITTSKIRACLVLYYGPCVRFLSPSLPRSFSLEYD